MTLENPLDDTSVRVLGALMEKEVTTPDNYPLTLNALTAACNQASNRDPVMSLEEGDVSRALQELDARGFARAVHRSDSRVRRYRQAITEKLSLHQPEAAAMCVLMLRGPQTTGEIRTRAARMFEFIDLAHVEITLQGLMTLSAPLVAQLPRQPGQKEVRYAHLLAGEPQVPAYEAPATRQETAGPSRMDLMEQELSALRGELAELRSQFEEFRRQFQ